MNHAVKTDAAGLIDPRPGIFTSQGFKQWRYLLFCFGIPVLVMAAIYACLEVFPVGESSVLVLDLNAQYVYFFEALSDIIHGDGSILYSFRRALGGEFLGMYAYYLASPFSFIIALFPSAYVTEALLVMMLLKTGLCGFTFGIYLDATLGRKNKEATVIFSLLYALCAYAVVMQNNTMWIDNMAMLPLVTLGIERIIKEKKFKLFIVSLLIAIFSNFYIGYMMCIYVAIYFFYYYAAYGKTDAINPLGEKRHFAKSLGRVVLYSAITVMMAAVIILPTLYSLTFGKTTFSDPNYAFAQQFDFFDLFAKMLIGSYDTVRPEGLPQIYCGMIVLLLVPLYFLSKKTALRERMATGILCLVFVLSFNGSTIDIFWHGMQRPNWLNYRYSFMLCFILLVMAAKAFRELKETNPRTVFAVGGVVLVGILLLQKLEYKFLDDMNAIWVSLAFTLIYMFVLHAVQTSGLIHFSTRMVALIVCIELFCAGLMNLMALDKDVIISSRTSYRTFMDRYQPVVDYIKEEDTSFYRMEKTKHRKTNDNMALGIYGVSNSTSTLNASVIDLLQKLGIHARSHWSQYEGGTPVFDALFGLKYIITENQNDVSEMYELYHMDDENELFVYENLEALSIAYGVHENVLSYDLQSDAYSTPPERMNALVTAMLGASEPIELFVPIPIEETFCTNTDPTYIAGHTEYKPKVAGEETRVTFRMTVPRNTDVYCYIPSDYARSTSMRVNGRSMGEYLFDRHFVLLLGNFEKDEELRVELTEKGDTLYLENGHEYFYYIDKVVYRDVMAKLSQSSYQITSFKDDYFKGTINVAEGQETIFTTIPYDEGWIIEVDGERVAPVKTLGSLLAFETTAGTHTVTMRYFSDALKGGLILSAAGLLGFAFALVVEQLGKKKKGTELPPILLEADGDPMLPPQDTLAEMTDEEAAEPETAPEADVPEEPEQTEE